tara:strand:- start:355 stop:732 length:378 start_codon:yes stop_codon:yes gene_type:complete
MLNINQLISNIIVENQNRNFTQENIYDTPIEPTKSEWETINFNGKNYLQRKFLIKKNKQVKFFLVEVLNIADKINHFPELLIKENLIVVSLTTHDLNQVSDTDIMFAKKIDDVYDDIKFIDELNF